MKLNKNPKEFKLRKIISKYSIELIGIPEINWQFIFLFLNRGKNELTNNDEENNIFNFQDPNYDTQAGCCPQLTALL